MRVVVVLCLVSCSEGAPEPVRHSSDRAGDNSGAIGPPPVVPIEIATACPALSRCGGDLAGTWHVADICVEEALLLRELTAACPELIYDGTTEAVAQGSMTFDGTVATREVATAVTVDVRFTHGCAACDCAAVETALEDDDVAVECQASCNASDECVCSIRSSVLVLDSTPYTVTGSNLTAADGTTFEFCVAGAELSFRETTVPPVEPGIYTLLRP